MGNEIVAEDIEDDSVSDIIDENPVKTCVHCSKEFDGDFELKDFSIICPHCKRPQ